MLMSLCIPCKNSLHICQTPTEIWLLQAYPKSHGVEGTVGMKLHSSCRRGREASLMLQGREDFSEVLCLMETALLPPGFFLPGGDFQTLPGCTGMPGALAKGSSTWKGNAEHIQRWFVVLVLQSKVTHSLLRAVSVTSHTPGLLPGSPN